MVRTKRQPWETTDPGVVDPSSPEHILQLVWERLPDNDLWEAAELPDVDSATLDTLPSTVRVVCVRDSAVLLDGDVRCLHVGAFGKDHAWRHRKPRMGAALPQPPPMQAAVRGSRVEFSAYVPTEVGPLVMRASGKARGVHFRPWIVAGTLCQSIRPQPTRAPCGEVMALLPSRWREPARVVAGGPTLVWGGGGVAWDSAAAALPLSPALGAARAVSRESPPPPPPGRAVATNQASRARRLTGDG